MKSSARAFGPWALGALLVAVAWGACDFEGAVTGYCGRNPQFCTDGGAQDGGQDGGQGDGGLDCTGAGACGLPGCAGQTCAPGSVCQGGGCTCVAIAALPVGVPRWLDMVGGPVAPQILVGSSGPPWYGACPNCTAAGSGFNIIPLPLQELASGRLLHGRVNEAIAGIGSGTVGSPSLVYAECSKVCENAANWSAPIRLGASVDLAVVPSIAGDANGTGILYASSAGTYSVVECAGAGCADAGAWSLPRVVTSVAGLSSPPVALLALGTDAQAAFVGNQYLTCLGGCSVGWTGITLPSGPSQWSGSLKAAAGPLGLPHFALLDSQGGLTRGACAFSPCGNGAWNVSTVENDAVGGTTVGFDVDPQGTEQIAYWSTGGLSLISVQLDGGVSKTSLETCGVKSGVGVALVAGPSPPAILIGSDSGVYFTFAP